MSVARVLGKGVLAGVFALLALFASILVAIMVVLAVPGFVLLTRGFGPAGEGGQTFMVMELTIVGVSAIALLVFVALVFLRARKAWRAGRRNGEEPPSFWTDLHTIRTLAIGIAVILGAQWLIVEVVHLLLPADFGSPG